MANTARGEYDIVLGGVTFTLAMEYSRIVELENVLGVGVIALDGRLTHLVESENAVVAIATSPLTAQDITHCVWLLSDKKHAVEYIGQLLLKHGLKNAIDPLSDFLAEAVAGAPVGESE